MYTSRNGSRNFYVQKYERVQIRLNIIPLLFSGIHEALMRPGPDLVICDEGHRIKNSHAGISKALKNIRTRYGALDGQFTQLW